MARAVNRCAEENGFSIVREIGGHGVGVEFHEDPWVGYTEPAQQGLLLAPGFVFTIEPMVNMGAPDIFLRQRQRLDDLHRGRPALRAVGGHHRRDRRRQRDPRVVSAPPGAMNAR